MIGGAGATVLASTAGVAIIGSLFGVAGLGLGGELLDDMIFMSPNKFDGVVL